MLLLLSFPVDVGQNLLSDVFLLFGLFCIVQCETEIVLNVFSPVDDSRKDLVEAVRCDVDDRGVSNDRDEDATVIAFPTMNHSSVIGNNPIINSICFSNRKLLVADSFSHYIMAINLLDVLTMGSFSIVLVVISNARKQVCSRRISTLHADLERLRGCLHGRNASAIIGKICDSLSHQLIGILHSLHGFVGIVELASYVSEITNSSTLLGMNIGGTVKLNDDFSVTMVKADHSSSIGARYLGEPTGLIIKVGEHTVYHFGDTGIFGDMKLINELYKPDVGLIPIGGRFTMDVPTAAYAVNEFFDFKTCIPMHYDTFPPIKADVNDFAKRVTRSKVAILKPFESVDL